jgi:hypothetical protein
MIYVNVTPAASAVLDEWDVRFYRATIESRFIFCEGRWPLCLHEAAHLVYSRACGHEPELYGPMIDYDSGRETLHLIDAAVEELPYEIRMNADPILVAKHYRGPLTVLEALGNMTREQARKEPMLDLRNLNNWFAERHRLRSDVQGITEKLVRDSVLRDLQCPDFCRKIWDAAREFEARVFGPEANVSREAA